MTLFINGVKLKGSLFAFELGKTPEGYKLFQNCQDDSEGITLTLDVINKRLVQILAFDELQESDIRVVNQAADQLAEPAKLLLKTFVLSTL